MKNFVEAKKIEKDGSADNIYVFSDFQLLQLKRVFSKPSGK